MDGAHHIPSKREVQISPSMKDQHGLSQVFDIDDVRERRMKKGGEKYNQVQPVALGQSRKIPSSENRKAMSEKEKTELLQRIIGGGSQQFPSGMREFILGCFQLAEQHKFDQSAHMLLVQQLKDLISKAYTEKKEYINDWWSQTIPCLTKSRTELVLACDKPSRKPSAPVSSPLQSSLPPPPPPPPPSQEAVRGTLRVPPPPPTVDMARRQNSNTVAPDRLASRSRGSTELERRRKRMERFSNDSTGSKKSKVTSDENFANLNAISTNFYKFDKNKPVVGRCQTLEKKYLRLTSEPNPDLVRPLNVLKKAYDSILEKHTKGEASYAYLCDQFKSMRQDLRVQIIENQFALKVYQTHARLALQNNDIGEFNQCQSRLGQLFELSNLPNSNLEEFVSYRILYYLMMNNQNSINELKLKYMTAENLAVYRHPIVRHALKMANSLLMDDYHSFFKLYAETSGPTRCLVDTFISRERLRALNTISKSYNQIPLPFLFKELQLQSFDEGVEFIEQLGLSQYVSYKNKGQEGELATLNTKTSRFSIIQQFEKSKRVDIKGQI